MHQRHLSSLYVLVFIAFVSNGVAQVSSTVSISDAPDMGELRDCARCALFGGSPCPDGNINDYLGCNLNNGCFCRTDLFSQVTSYVSSVINAHCTPGPASDDITSANSIYSRYCATVNGLVTTPTSPNSNPNSSPHTTAAPGVGTTVVSNTEPPVISTAIEITTATSSSVLGSSGSAVTTSKWLSLLLVSGHIGALLFKVRLILVTFL
jgi:hypothetical protein